MKYDRLKMTDAEKIQVLTDFGMEVKRSTIMGKETWDVTLPGEEPMFPKFLRCGDQALDAGLTYIEHQDPISVDDLLARGARQTSRKYRGVACLPRGMTGIEALKERSPEQYTRLLKDMESRAADMYRTYVAQSFGDHYELSVEQFNEFLAKTGRKPNTFLEEKREACTGCRTLGHMHRRGCPEENKPKPVPADVFTGVARS